MNNGLYKNNYFDQIDVETALEREIEIVEGLEGKNSFYDALRFPSIF